MYPLNHTCCSASFFTFFTQHEIVAAVTPVADVEILNPDLEVDEFMDKKDQREKRQQELLKLIS